MYTMTINDDTNYSGNTSAHITATICANADRSTQNFFLVSPICHPIRGEEEPTD